MASRFVQQRPPLRGALWPVACVALLCSCSQIPDFTSPSFPFQDRYTGQKTAAPVVLENSAWWRRFEDPVLSQLVASALTANLDLALARERVIEASARARSIEKGFRSSATIGTEVQGGSQPNDPVVRTDADASLTWLFDPYGGRKAQHLAARARIDAADAELDAARLLMISSLVSTYIELRFIETSLALRHKEQRARRRSLGLVRELFAAETATRLDVLQSEALLAETQTVIPGLEAQKAARVNEIAVLLGQAPGSLTLPPGRTGKQLKVPDGAKLGVPADLVRNRPDIRINERLYYAAISDIGAARAALYPSLSLTGTISIAAFEGNEINTYGFGPSLTLPALPNGPRKAAVEVAESRARQAHSSWKLSVLNAIGAVETALSDYHANYRVMVAARRSVQLYERTVTLTRELLLNEAATVTDLLDAERRVAEVRITLSAAERDLAQSFAALNVALGSGNRAQ